LYTFKGHFQYQLKQVLSLDIYRLNIAEYMYKEYGMHVLYDAFWKVSTRYVCYVFAFTMPAV